MSEKVFNIAASVNGLVISRMKNISAVLHSNNVAISFLTKPGIANSDFCLGDTNQTKLFRHSELARANVLLRTEKFTSFFFHRTFFFFLFFSLFVLRLLFLFSFPFSF